MRACRKCPIYDRAKRTCGNGTFYVDEESHALETKLAGCHCYMPWKAQCADVNCWAWERYLPYGWPDELNR